MILIEGRDAKLRHHLGAALRARLPSWSYRVFPTVNRGTMTDADYLAVVADAHPRMICEPFHWTHRALLGTELHTACCSPAATRVLNLALAALGTVVVLALDQPYWEKAQWGSTPSLTTASDAERADWRFLHQAGIVDDGAPPPFATCVIANPANLKDEAALDALARRAQVAAQEVAALPPPCRGLGGPRAEFMVMGEGLPPMPPGVGPGDRPAAPEFPLSQGPTGRWWWETVDRYDLRWQHGYFTNAAAFGTPGSFRCLLQNGLRNVRTVACLGERALKLALDEVYDQGVQVVGISHPAHVRQWRRRERERWQSEVASALGSWVGAQELLHAQRDEDD